MSQTKTNLLSDLGPAYRVRQISPPVADDYGSEESNAPTNELETKKGHK